MNTPVPSLGSNGESTLNPGDSIPVQFNAGYVAAIGEGVLLPDHVKDLRKKTVIRLSQENIKSLHDGKEEQLGLDEELIQQLVDTMSASITEINGSTLEDVVDKLKIIAHYIIENLHRYKKVGEDQYVRLNQSPSLTFMREGRVAVSLKKLGKLIGKGTFKLAKFAIIIKVSENELSLKKGVSATMSPLTQINRIAANNEKNMMLRLKELGKHPNIVTCYSVTDYKQKKSENPKICLIMEYCDQGNLKERYVGKEDIPHIIEGTLNGLVFLHANNIFHSDIKPTNILLTRGDQLEAKIADFGCARDLNDPKQRTYFLGDRSFFSPELKQLEEKMLRKIQPFMSQEHKERLTAEQNYQEALKVVEEAKRNKDKKFEMKEAFVGNEEVDLINQTQQEFDEAVSYYTEVNKALDFTIEAKKKAEANFNQKRDLLTEKFRREIYPVDENILKSDIYAVGKTFEYLCRNQMNRITPEMKRFLEELSDINLDNRPSAQEALQKFLSLKQEGKIFISDLEIVDDNSVLLAELENQSSDDEIDIIDELSNYGLPKLGHY